MQQLVNVIMLPTDKKPFDNQRDCPVVLTEDGNGGFVMLFNTTGFRYGQHDIAQQIYFIKDEDIKEGDWFICIPETQAKPSLHQCGNPTGSVKYVDTTGGFGIFKHLCKKIEATTNPEVWLNAAKSGSNSPIYNIAKIPQSFITAYVSAYNEGKPIKQVMLEYEERWYCKSCSSLGGGIRHCAHPEECENVQSIRQLKLNPDGSVIWSLIKEEKMYTREEAEDIAYEAIKAFANREIRGSSHWFTGKHSFAPELSEWFAKYYPE